MKSDPSDAVSKIIETNALAEKPVYLLESPPTAENIAEELGKICQDLLAVHPVTVIRVVVWETPNCYASWEPR
jgi:hypothetical protein